MLEYLLDELEKCEKEYAQELPDAVKIAHVHAVYEKVNNYLDWYDLSKNSLRKELKESLGGLIVLALSLYGVHEKPGVTMYIALIMAILFNAVCVYDSDHAILSYCEDKKRLKSYVYDLDIDRYRFKKKKELIDNEYREETHSFKELEEYLNNLKGIIKNIDEGISSLQNDKKNREELLNAIVCEELQKYPEIMGSYLNQEFEKFLDERISPEKIDITAPLIKESHVKVYKRVN